MRLEQLRPGLYRWTAVHPDADPNPKPGSPADWGPEVGSVAYAAEDALVLVDPLVPDDRWDALDELVQRHGRRLPVGAVDRGHQAHNIRSWSGFGATPQT